MLETTLRDDIKRLESSGSAAGREAEAALATQIAVTAQLEHTVRSLEQQRDDLLAAANVRSMLRECVVGFRGRCVPCDVLAM